VSEILANKEQWLNVDETSLAGRSKRRRQSDYPNIEEAMGLWIENAVRDNITLTDHIVKQNARQFTTLFEYQSFSAANGWLHGFKKRNNLQSYKKCGEAGSVNSDLLPQQRFELKLILAGYIMWGVRY